MSTADLRLFFFVIFTGTNENDIFEMAEKPATESANLRVLAHLAIVYANECAQNWSLGTEELIAVPAAVSQISPAVHRPVC